MRSMKNSGSGRIFILPCISGLLPSAFSVSAHWYINGLKYILRISCKGSVKRISKTRGRGRFVRKFYVSHGRMPRTGILLTDCLCRRGRHVWKKRSIKAVSQTGLRYEGGISMNFPQQFISASTDYADFDHQVPAPYIRKKFTLDAAPRTAELLLSLIHI